MIMYIHLNLQIVFDSLAAFFICLFAILMTTQSPCAGAGIAMFLSDVCSRYNTAIAFGFISVATNIWTIGKVNRLFIF